MALDPRTPVLVGAGGVQQREDDFDKALEPVELMIAALERAAEDAGTRALLARADSIRAPRGQWGYSDPCRWPIRKWFRGAAHRRGFHPR